MMECLILTRLQIRLFNLAGYPRKEHLLGQPVLLWVGHFGKEGNMNYRLYSKAPPLYSVTARFFVVVVVVADSSTSCRKESPLHNLVR